MKIENQITNLSQSKKLKELGIVQQSLFTWCVYCPDPIGEKYYYIPFYKDDNSPEAEFSEIVSSAYTLSELQIMLPNGYCSGNGTNSELTKWCDKLSRNFDTGIYPFEDVATTGLTQVQACASKLIQLLELGEILVDEVNNRLLNS